MLHAKDLTWQEEQAQKHSTYMDAIYVQLMHMDSMSCIVDHCLISCGKAAKSSFDDAGSQVNADATCHRLFEVDA